MGQLTGSILDSTAIVTTVSWLPSSSVSVITDLCDFDFNDLHPGLLLLLLLHFFSPLKEMVLRCFKDGAEVSSMMQTVAMPSSHGNPSKVNTTFV